MSGTNVTGGIALAILAVLLPCCGKSPVPLEKTVALRGAAAPGITMVKMVNVMGTADRTAAVDGQRKYEFLWTGADLTGTFGERKFFLRAPADPGSDAAFVTSAQFNLRGDLSAPQLAVWNPLVTVERTLDGGLRLRYQGVDDTMPIEMPAAGPIFQPIEQYRVRLEYRKMVTDTNGQRSEQAAEATFTASPSEATVTAADLRGLGRSQPAITVYVEAQGQGAPLALTYHAKAVVVSVPL